MTTTAGILRDLLDTNATQLQTICQPTPIQGTTTTQGLIKLLYPYQPEKLLHLLLNRALNAPTDINQIAELANLAADTLDLADKLFPEIRYDTTAVDTWAATTAPLIPKIRNNGLTFNTNKYTLNVIAQLIYLLDPQIRDKQLIELTNDTPHPGTILNIIDLKNLLNQFTAAYRVYVNQGRHP